MKFLSVCSGIEAASVAWNPLGWEAVAFSEIESFPSQVLKHHYPHVPNLGDMTKFKEWNLGSIDLLCGGTPCQSFSVAGLRKGLADPRGNLALTYCAILDHLKPRWFVWENVPGVLSSGGGRDFGSFLGAVAELGYGWAYRVLDAQYFGVAQRRRRVFVVGYLGNWHPAAKVLFERESLRRDTAPSREAGKVAPTIPSRSTGGGGLGTDFDCDGGVIARSTFCIKGAAIGRKPEAGPQHGEVLEDVVYTQNCVEQHAVAYSIALQDSSYTVDTAATQGVVAAMQVRRLTPVECERLQGFPDNYTAIPWRKKPADECPDGPRYKALGNSWAVPVAHWIGKRIQELS